MYESWQICMSHGRMSHVTHQEVMAHLSSGDHHFTACIYIRVMALRNSSWHIGIRHGTYEFVKVSVYKKASRHTQMSKVKSEYQRSSSYGRFTHMSHDACWWVIAHMNTSRHTSRHTRMSHVTTEHRLSLFHGIYVYMSHGTYEWVMAHTSESCHTQKNHITSKYQWSSFYDMHIWVMARMNESWHTWMSHFTHEWVMPH